MLSPRVIKELEKDYALSLEIRMDAACRAWRLDLYDPNVRGGWGEPHTGITESGWIDQRAWLQSEVPLETALENLFLELLGRIHEHRKRFKALAAAWESEPAK